MLIARQRGFDSGNCRNVALFGVSKNLKFYKKFNFWFLQREQIRIQLIKIWVIVWNSKTHIDQTQICFKIYFDSKISDSSQTYRSLTQAYTRLKRLLNRTKQQQKLFICFNRIRSSKLVVNRIRLEPWMKQINSAPRKAVACQFLSATANMILSILATTWLRQPV